MADIIALHLEVSGGIQFHPTVANERDAAIADLLHDNTFRLHSGLQAPYSLQLATEENSIVFRATSQQQPDGAETIRLPVAGLRGVVRDYFLICDSYYQAMTAINTSRLEAIDMGRRGAHNAGAEKLEEILKCSVQLDFNTARRLFTLVCVLHIRSQQKVLV